VLGRECEGETSTQPMGRSYIAALHRINFKSGFDI